MGRNSLAKQGKMKRYRQFRLSLGWQILIGLVLGIILGVVFYGNKTAITAMQNIGTMFISLIQMIVLPIVVACLITGIANMGDLKKLGRIGGKTIIYFEVMTTIAIFTSCTPRASVSMCRRPRPSHTTASGPR